MEPFRALVIGPPKLFIERKSSSGTPPQGCHLALSKRCSAPDCPVVSACSVNLDRRSTGWINDVGFSLDACGAPRFLVTQSRHGEGNRRACTSNTCVGATCVYCPTVVRDPPAGITNQRPVVLARALQVATSENVSNSAEDRGEKTYMTSRRTYGAIRKVPLMRRELLIPHVWLYQEQQSDRGLGAWQRALLAFNSVHVDLGSTLDSSACTQVGICIEKLGVPTPLTYWSEIASDALRITRPSPSQICPNRASSGGGRTNDAQRTPHDVDIDNSCGHIFPLAHH